jgi:hypothetical protein
MNDKTYGINKRGQIQQRRVESDNTHAMQGIAIRDISADHRIPHLNAGRKEEECDLTNNPMISLIDTDSPDDQANTVEQAGGTYKPQPHLRETHTCVWLGEAVSRQGR